MRIKKHIPNACEGVEKEEAEFDTLDELFEIPFVKMFRMDPFEGKEPHCYFKTYSVSEYGPNMCLLIVEYQKDEHWTCSHWVVAFIEAHVSDLTALGLPIFERNKNE